MPVVTLREILKNAGREKYAVGMFDVHHSDMAEAVLEAAEERNAPVILALAEIHAAQPRQLTLAGSMIVRAAERASIPVTVHLDHAVLVETAVRAMELGFSSVMYDGSLLSLEENLENSAKTVFLARQFGASVEAELGHVGGEEGNPDANGGSVYTKPEDAAYFSEMTGVDALAVSIGTVHGRYREKPNLNIPLLQEIKRRVSIPLVLHGGSGLSDQDFKDCIAGGISKINIYTEIAEAARKVLIEDDRNLGYFDLMQKSKGAMQAVAAEKIKLFGSQGKASALLE
ncbi:MAG: class II fructose-bisphosphate aldolase [Clostridiaceae bacterium]|nr:class II fructose-bisphosphate aldolase [Clostridiaceae bacterium]